jgi:hypothetical protein
MPQKSEQTGLRSTGLLLFNRGPNELCDLFLETDDFNCERRKTMKVKTKIKAGPRKVYYSDNF